jgi:2-oxoglutarate dehydrogenase E1 component
MKELDTCLFGTNTAFIEEIYHQYLQDPTSVDVSWHKLFKAYQNGENLSSNRNNTLAKFTLNEQAQVSDSAQSIIDYLRVQRLVCAYRTRGHYLAKLDPLAIEVAKQPEELGLDPARYGFTNADLDRDLFVGEELAGVTSCTLRELIAKLQNVYATSVGAEFRHIKDEDQRKWLQNELEISSQKEINKEEKISILKDILEVEGFEQFLHVKFPGTKRFSVEGGATSINAAETVIKTAAKLGIEEVIIGMPHRGRLNVLTKVLRKPYTHMLSEFQGNLAHPAELNISGDVKYHLGFTVDREIENSKTVHLSLTANPSHLEAVNPVVLGKVRAKQDQRGDKIRGEKVMGMLLHGDAAFAGQGVVAESLSLADLNGYSTGGTVHIIVNNQIGFTTGPKSARASRYPTEFAKIIQAPIFHVNGDDPEAVVKVSEIAAKFRHQFKKDVVIDVICYRLHGHNETDEPNFTQPLMYKKIAAHKTAMDLYADKLKSQNVITGQDFEEFKKQFRSFLDQELEASKTYKPTKGDWLEGKWEGMEYKPTAQEPVTGLSVDKLKFIGEKISAVPVDFQVNSKIQRQLEAKKKMMETGLGFDWATAEALAFGSLLEENTVVRLSGQDAGRGTFSHRHAVLVDQATEQRFIPLNSISGDQAKFEVIDSNLSEFAVLGYEYGYSCAEPKGLVLWEGQFGDFVNGAQVIIDQFISSAEVKWLRMSGLVMLLPHGYEGQGPEHSSARLERFLQLCAEDNIQVANCTTPASYFHILRRQIHRNFRKPLIIMSPKSLLRHKLAISTLAEMAEGTTFRPVIPEISQIAEDSKIKKVIITSGKVYYDIYEEREKRAIKDIAIIRMEQYYPFPEKELAEQLKRYKNAQIVWAQEEPRNMGAWCFVAERIDEVLAKSDLAAKRVAYVGRKEAASPAAGYKKMHDKEQEELINAALS